MPPKFFIGLKNGLLIAMVFYLLLFILCKIALAVEIDMEAIATIESNGNPKAYNRQSRAVGMYQLTEAVIIDYNRAFGRSISLLDAYNPDIARVIAHWYLTVEIPRLLRYYNKQVNLENTLISYNCGIACVLNPDRIGGETILYIKKYYNLTKKRRGS